MDDPDEIQRKLKFRYEVIDKLIDFKYTLLLIMVTNLVIIALLVILVSKTK